MNKKKKQHTDVALQILSKTIGFILQPYEYIPFCYDLCTLICDCLWDYQTFIMTGRYGNPKPVTVFTINIITHSRQIN